MEFLIEILLGCAIICVFFLVLKTKEYKTNADSLQNQLNSHDLLETKLHKTIVRLQEALATEQESTKAKDIHLKKQEKSLLKDIATIEKNLEIETTNRKKILSQKKSSEVRLGNIAEKLAPFLEDFDFDPEDATFLGKPIDYIVFEEEEITFVEIKMGKSQLSTKQRHIRNLIKNKQVAWKEIRIK